MARFYIVKKDDLTIYSSYEADSNLKGQFCGGFEDSDSCEHVQSDVDIIWAVAQDDGNGNIVIVENPDKPTEEELAYQVLRATRDSKLMMSDWTQTNDCPLSAETIEACKIYRQALRDLPTSTVDPKNPIWPTPPDCLRD